MLVFLALLAAEPDPKFAQLRASIAKYCKGEKACIKRQSDSVRHFMGLMVLSDHPRGSEEACMRSATKGKLTNWTAAETCLRKRSRGSVIAREMKRGPQ
jgi:hypothetical protein